MKAILGFIFVFSFDSPWAAIQCARFANSRCGKKNEWYTRKRERRSLYYCRSPSRFLSFSLNLIFSAEQSRPPSCSIYTYRLWPSFVARSRTSAKQYLLRHRGIVLLMSIVVREGLVNENFVSTPIYRPEQKREYFSSTRILFTLKIY